MHYWRLRSHGTVERSAQPSVCTVEECDRPSRARGYCDMHYSRWRLCGVAGPAEPYWWRDPARDPAIIAARAAGQTLRQIGDANGITPRRVRQILKKALERPLK
jgi:Sigma-70, region 4